jgi:hypothetical protein
VLAALALLAASGLPGCGGEPRGRVFGKVTFRGAPVTQGMVLFNNAAKGVYMSTEIHPDGSYLVLTAKGVGLPLGSYLVAVAPPLVEPTGFARGSAKYPECDNIPVKYRDPKTSGLSLEVRKGENPFSIDLQPEGPG